MGVFLAECFWPDVTEEEVADLLAQVLAAAEQLRCEGHDIRVSESWRFPLDEVAFFFIDAQTSEEAAAVGVRAAVPFERIAEALPVALAAVG